MITKQRDPEREQFWRTTVREWSASQQTIRDFCLHRGLAETAFHFWRKELRRRDAEAAARPSPPSPAFVAVTVAPPAQAAVAVEVRCPSGHVVAIGGCDPAILRAVFAALRPEAAC